MTKKVLVSLPSGLLERADKLVEQGLYSSRSALVERAIHDLIERELVLLKAIREAEERWVRKTLRLKK